MIFREYLKEKFRNEDIIEFGPLNRPLFKKEECKTISYADIRSTEEVKQLYLENDYLKKTGITVDINSIVDIDYKLQVGSYVNTFKDKKFGLAYLSHVIEHMPDIIYFFNDIEKILTDDGKLAIIYPDKRYCFDHYRNSAAFRDAYSTYKYGIKENARFAFDFSYNVVHENEAKFFWDNEKITDVINRSNLEEAEKYYQETLNGNISNEDIHFWPFSDIDFLKFIYEMKKANLFNYDIEEFYPTQYNTQEFMIVLKKSTNSDCSNILELIDKYDSQIIEKQYRETVEKKDKQIEELKIKIEEKDKQIGDLKIETEEKDKKLNQLNEQAKKRESQIEIEKNEIKVKIKQLEESVQEKERQIIQINESKSMKVTAPLRKLAKIINKGE